jgi:hypothetical protein
MAKNTVKLFIKRGILYWQFTITILNHSFYIVTMYYIELLLLYTTVGLKKWTDKSGKWWSLKNYSMTKCETVCVRQGN